MSTSSGHPLAAVLADAAAGRFPPTDGQVDVMPPDAAGTHAVVELTAHAYVLTDRRSDDPLLAAADGFGGATDPALLVELAGPGGWIGSLDLVLVRRAIGDGSRSVPGVELSVLTDHDEHPRVVRSRHHRRDVRVLGDERGIVTIGRGLVDRLEISVELTGSPRSERSGRALVDAAVARLPDDSPVWAQVAPGNAASVRMFLGCGFVPIGSEVLIEPAAG